MKKTIVAIIRAFHINRLMVTIFTYVMISNLLNANELIPKCDSKEGWIAQVTLVSMKNTGVIKDSSNVFILENNLIDYRKIGPYPESDNTVLYRQVHEIIVQTKDRGAISLITIHDASIEECSFSELTVIQISPYVKVIRLGLTQIESMIDNKYFLENIIDNKKKTMLPSQSNLNATIKNK